MNDAVPPVVCFCTASEAVAVFVNVHVTSSPAPRSTLTPFVVLVKVLAVAVPVSTQERAPSVQPVGTVSVAVYVPADSGSDVFVCPSVRLKPLAS